jgi:broad specificity phosphatase PhoE
MEGRQGMTEARAELWLMRHGETAWSLSGREAGRTDLHLTAAGKRRAEALGRHLAGRSFALVLCSPLARAVETCRLAGYGDAAEFTDGLLEWDYGQYEGRFITDIRNERRGWTIWSEGTPGGETIEQVATRAQKVVDRAVAAGGDVALFAHAKVLRVLTTCWLGLPPDAGRMFTLGTASLSVLGYEQENRVIRLWNQDSHLVFEEDA